MKLISSVSALIAVLTISGKAVADEATATAPATAAAPSVSAEKKSGIQTLLPGAYAKIDLRLEVLRAEDGNTFAYDRTGMEALPHLGASLFDDKVDTSFTWRFKHETSTNTVKKIDMYNETQWNIVEGKINDDSPYSFGPYAFTDFFNPPGGASTTFGYADVGLYGEVNYQFAIPSGAIALMAYEQPLAEFVTPTDNADSSQAQPVNVQADKGANDLKGTYGLTVGADNSVKTNQRDPLLINYSGASIKYKPAAIKDFAVSLAYDLAQVWLPEYSLKTSDNDKSVERTGYQVQILSINKLNFSYKISDKLSIVNSTRAFLAGYDQSQIDVKHPDATGLVGPYHWENRLQLSATLL